MRRLIQLLALLSETDQHMWQCAGCGCIYQGGASKSPSPCCNK